MRGDDIAMRVASLDERAYDIAMRVASHKKRVHDIVMSVASHDKRAYDIAMIVASHDKRAYDIAEIVKSLLFGTVEIEQIFITPSATWYYTKSIKKVANVFTAEDAEVHREIHYFMISVSLWLAK